MAARATPSDSKLRAATRKTLRTNTKRPPPPPPPARTHVDHEVRVALGAAQDSAERVARAAVQMRRQHRLCVPPPRNKTTRRTTMQSVTPCDGGRSRQQASAGAKSRTADTDGEGQVGLACTSERRPWQKLRSTHLRRSARQTWLTHAEQVRRPHANDSQQSKPVEKPRKRMHATSHRTKQRKHGAHRRPQAQQQMRSTSACQRAEQRRSHAAACCCWWLASRTQQGTPVVSE